MVAPIANAEISHCRTNKFRRSLSPRRASELLLCVLSKRPEAKETPPQFVRASSARSNPTFFGPARQRTLTRRSTNRRALRHSAQLAFDAPRASRGSEDLAMFDSNKGGACALATSILFRDIQSKHEKSLVRPAQKRRRKPAPLDARIFHAAVETLQVSLVKHHAIRSRAGVENTAHAGLSSRAGTPSHYGWTCPANALMLLTLKQVFRSSYTMYRG